jgi:hypothetical protein
MLPPRLFIKTNFDPMALSLSTLDVNIINQDFFINDDVAK